MRGLAVPLLLLLSGCLGGTQATQAPLPDDFTVTQPAAAGVRVEASYALHVEGPTLLNATLVWGTAGNLLELSVDPAGNGGAVVVGTVARLHRTLAPGDYTLRVAGTPRADDTWHLEAHFTRA